MENIHDQQRTLKSDQHTDTSLSHCNSVWVGGAWHAGGKRARGSLARRKGLCVYPLPLAHLYACATGIKKWSA
jgi:hypothetical protein